MAAASSLIESNQATNFFSRGKESLRVGAPKWLSEAKYTFLPSDNSMFVGSSNELGALESGIAAKIFGAPLAVMLGGTVTLIVVLIIGAKNKPLRELDLQQDVEANYDEAKEWLIFL